MNGKKRCVLALLFIVCFVGSCTYHLKTGWQYAAEEIGLYTAVTMNRERLFIIPRSSRIGVVIDTSMASYHGGDPEGNEVTDLLQSKGVLMLQERFARVHLVTETSVKPVDFILKAKLLRMENLSDEGPSSTVTDAMNTKGPSSDKTESTGSINHQAASKGVASAEEGGEEEGGEEEDKQFLSASIIGKAIKPFKAKILFTLTDAYTQEVRDVTFVDAKSGAIDNKNLGLFIEQLFNPYVDSISMNLIL